MNGLGRSPVMAAMISIIFMVSGCTVYPVHHHDAGYGPPPHAPAHGYRYKYQDHDFVYDADLGVYIVIGLRDYYFYDDYYYRYDNNHWYYSRDLDRDWHDYNEGKLPPGLAKKHGYGKKDKGKN